MHRIMRIAFMSDMTIKPRAVRLPKINDTFNDEVDMWNAYPFSRSIVPHRPTLYLLERCRLAGLFQEMHDLIFTEKSKAAVNKEFMNAVESLAAKMHQWLQHLPFELQYDWPMSVAVLELQYVHNQTSSHATPMILIDCTAPHILPFPWCSDS